MIMFKIKFYINNKRILRNIKLKRCIYLVLKYENKD